MKVRTISLLLILCLLFSACGSQKSAESQKTPDTGITFTDDLGRRVTVDAPKRVAPLLGSFAQVWMLAGGTVHATAEDAWEDLHLDLPESAINLGHTKKLSLELLLDAEPDFILASVNTRQQVEWKETLEATGIPVAYFDISDFDDYLRLLSVCTDITGQKELYEKNGREVQKQIEAVRQQSKTRLEKQNPPTVLSMVASAGNVYVKNSQGNVLGEMLHDLGCINIADSESHLLENLSLEHILQADPDYIFIVQRGDDTEGMRRHVRQMMSENPAWGQLSAVQNNRIYFMEKNLYNLKPNHRWGEAYEKLEAIFRENQE